MRCFGFIKPKLGDMSVTACRRFPGVCAYVCKPTLRGRGETERRGRLAVSGFRPGSSMGSMGWDANGPFCVPVRRGDRWVGTERDGSSMGSMVRDGNGPFCVPVHRGDRWVGTLADWIGGRWDGMGRKVRGSASHSVRTATAGRRRTAAGASASCSRASGRHRTVSRCAPRCLRRPAARSFRSHGPG